MFSGLWGKSGCAFYFRMEGVYIFTFFFLCFSSGFFCFDLSYRDYIEMWTIDVWWRNGHFFFLLFKLGFSFQRLSFFHSIFITSRESWQLKKSNMRRKYSYSHIPPCWKTLDIVFTFLHYRSSGMIHSDATLYFEAYAVFSLKIIRWNIRILPPFLNRSCC